jgi:hypothetical protein
VNVLALFGVTFLTPLDGLFVVAAVVPLAALLLTERRAARIRRVLSLATPGRRALLPVALALVLLPALVAVAAAQPVVVQQRFVNQRADAQAFFVLDTSQSMEAAAGPGGRSRLARAKRLALRLRNTLPDLPVGIASMTDRALPNLMPTTDPTLFLRTLAQSVGINSPPPSQKYPGRATSFTALVPLVGAHFFSTGVERRVLVVFTDGESLPIPQFLGVQIQRRVTPIYVHVWRPGERIIDRAGKPDRGYVSDPTSADQLAQLAKLTSGSTYDESQLPQVAKAVRNAVGYAQTQTQVDAYARVPLAPWFVLAGVVPLAFLFWRRNL